jgi:hypothetical protein
MKAVLDLTKAITDGQYYEEQFEGNGMEKNILFVEPQLTSKHLYKFILPFFSFYNEKVFTAITGLGKYDPARQIVGLETLLNQKEILWANYIVFPFTTMPIAKEYGIYEAIREVNPSCKIVFFVDFNFYELPEDHPHKELFQFEGVMDNVEMNILMSDFCFSSNLQLRGYLLKKFTELADTKYAELEHIPVNFGAVPYLIDEQIVLQNIDFESSKPESVIKKLLFEKVAEAAQEIKAEDIQAKAKRGRPRLHPEQTPRKAITKTKKVEGNKRGRKPKEKPEDVANVGVTTIEAPLPEVKVEPLPKKYRIGVICSPSNHGDIKAYNAEFQKINEMFGDDVALIFIGYDLEADVNKVLEGVTYEYVKEVSIIHFFKQLQSLKLDIVFVPLRKNVYNVTSENINKYLECGIFGIPVIVDDMFPYNQIILNQRNGFLYKGKDVFLQDLEATLRNPDLIKSVSAQCIKDVQRSYTYNDRNVEIISSIYS